MYWRPLCVLAMIYVSTSIPVQPPNPLLPPCGSYSDCSSGEDGSYNFRPDVPSASSCYSLCQTDPHCKYYSYNYSMDSPHYRHCYLSTGCARLAQGRTSTWISGPKICGHQVINSSDIENYTSHIFFRATK